MALIDLNPTHCIIIPNIVLRHNLTGLHRTNPASHDDTVTESTSSIICTVNPIIATTIMNIIIITIDIYDTCTYTEYSLSERM
jgi:hypothetical protein